METLSRCVEYLKYCIKNEWNTLITQFLLILMVNLIIEFELVFNWEAEDGYFPGWLKESLVSSGLSAGAAVVLSGMVRALNVSCRPRDASDPLTLRDYMIFYTGAELLSGVVSFGVGLGMDSLSELGTSIQTHTQTDALDALSTIINVPVKVVSCVGIFKGLAKRMDDWRKRKVFAQESDSELSDNERSRLVLALSQ